MKKLYYLFTLALLFSLVAEAQNNDMYYVPKKKTKSSKAVTPVPAPTNRPVNQDTVVTPLSTSRSFSFTEVVSDYNSGNERDVDEYNRRYAYRVVDGDTSVIDTVYVDEDVENEEGWINGFEGSESDYEYALRLIRFRNPRYAIPVSSPLYWDVVYGGALWPEYDWNIYNDGLYAYVFPTYTNYYWSDWRLGWGGLPYYGYGPGWDYGYYSPYYGWNYGYGLNFGFSYLSFGYGYGWGIGPHYGITLWGGGGWNGHLTGSRNLRRNDDDNRRTSSRPSGVRVAENGTRSSSMRSSNSTTLRGGGGSGSSVRSSNNNGARTRSTVKSTSNNNGGSNYNRPSSTRSTVSNSRSSSSSSVVRSTTPTTSRSTSTPSRSSSSSVRSTSTPSSSRSSSYSSGSSSRGGSSYSSGGGSSSRSSGGSSRGSGGRR